MAWSLALAVGAVVVRELVRPRPERPRLIDWELVEALALRHSGEAHEPSLGPELLASYEAMAARLEPLLDAALAGGSAEVTVSYPPLRPVGRRDWVRFNVRIFRQMFQPLEQLEQQLPGSLLLRWGQAGLTRYLGFMLGLLARRVLGQYDPALLGREPLETSALILVEPNVQAWAQRENLPVDELRQWLAMHELTHAWEFRAHPWLQVYLEDLLRQVLIGRLLDGRRPTAFELIRTLTVGMGQQWRAIAKLQATMSLLEGFSNLMMDDIGVRELPHFGVLEAAYRRRLLNRTPLERALLRLTGLEMKMQQYIQGERFARSVREQGGMTLLAHVWRGPEWLPTMEEIRRPELWIARAGAAAA
jgi:coenzyme F420 biosynthesis associated uncharacterized protein